MPKERRLWRHVSVLGGAECGDGEEGAAWTSRAYTPSPSCVRHHAWPLPLEPLTSLILGTLRQHGESRNPLRTVGTLMYWC